MIEILLAFIKFGFACNLEAFGFSYLDDGASQNRCGLHKDYELEEDSDSKRKRYPWFALIRIQV